MHPAVSIIMPTFNSQEFIDESLKSIAMQSFQDFELIICDGGSTDKTLELIRSIIGKKAILASTSDSSVPEGLNRGFNAAKGKVLCWLNSDDVFVSKNAIELVFERYNKKSFDVAIADSVVLNQKGKVVKTLIAFGPSKAIPQTAGNIFTGSLFFSRKAWSEFGGFSCKYKCAFEYEITDWLYAHYTVVKINVVVGGFRIHDKGISSKYSEMLRNELIEMRRDQPPIGKISYVFNRCTQHFIDKNLSRVVINKLRDPNIMLDWHMVDSDGWIG
jgi:glycosyltransferase involved in cell wall biosynthesis